MRRVERERARLQLVDGRAVVGARVALAVAMLLEARPLAVTGGRRDHDDALAQPERGLDRIGQPGRIRRRLAGRFRPTHDEAVHHDLDRVALVLVEAPDLRQVHLLAIHPDADEALLARGLEDAVALGLAILDERPQHQEPAPLGQRVDLVDHLLDGLALDLAPADGAVRVPDPGEQEPQVVVDLGHGADGRARVPAGALLVDGDRRREAVDLVDVRLLHLAQELARVRREALDVPALALGVDGVEGEAALARPGEAGDHHQPVPRDADRDVLQVVLAGTANDELVGRHCRCSVPGSGVTARAFYSAASASAASAIECVVATLSGAGCGARSGGGRSA